MRIRHLLNRSSAQKRAHRHGPPSSGPLAHQGPPRREVARREVTTGEVDRLVEAGRLAEAVDLLEGMWRTTGDPELEVRLVDLRHAAARALVAGPGRMPWPVPYADPFPDVVGRPPEVPAADLSPEVAGGAVAHHGALVVRGLFDEHRVERALDAIRRTQARRDEHEPGSEGERWYRPFRTGETITEVLRRMVADQGGTWLADSPASTARILDDLRAVGIVDVFTEHFGERPFFSLQKSTLRRSLPIDNIVAWHQDGSFLDADVRTMNVWLALSTCGADHPTPGMEVVPKRVGEVLPVDGKLTKHSISADLVAEVAGETPIIRPEFAPGDAMIFDEVFVHRTHLSPHMTEDRYALECWFFAPSHASNSYVPFLV